MEQQQVELRRQMERRLNEKLSEVKRQCDAEKQRAVEETKKKQWCANCGKEALFFCCWNTSYCDYPCQQAHWPHHMGVCGQNSDSSSSNINNGPSNSHDAAPSDSLNGDMAPSHGSRGPTPIHGMVSQVRLDFVSCMVSQVRLDFVSCMVSQVRLDFVSCMVSQVRLDIVSCMVSHVRHDVFRVMSQVRLDFMCRHSGPLSCMLSTVSQIAVPGKTC
ncbi:Zinc finger MYND-type [Trinorchestia longiramus]|nr:Zinc finger MYND-type [Trinorchestia longiramus]